MSSPRTRQATPVLFLSLTLCLSAGVGALAVPAGLHAQVTAPGFIAWDVITSYSIHYTKLYD